ncbi:MAG: hypothetical protein J0I03_03830, partial [Dysgonomonas mossii]|nr:hypothetical protein [Dysgonomonas mossii]
SIPEHPFIKKIIEKVFSPRVLEYGKNEEYDSAYMRKHFCVMNTTGPWVLMNLYEGLTTKQRESVFLIPAKYVTPFDGYQAELFRSGERGEDLEHALKDAYAVHYFFSNWRKEDL